MHQKTEGLAVPMLEELRQERLDFLQCDDNAVMFFHFIGHQYFRTQRIREVFKHVLGLSEPGYDFSRLHHVLCYCAGDNLGCSLYCDRKRIRIIFLTDQKCGFITGDQPIVNLDRTVIKEHDDIALYYPLSPSQSLLLAFGDFQVDSLDVSDEIVTQLNEAIAFKSRQFLVGVSNDVLRNHLIKPTEFPDAISLLNDNLK